MSLVSNFVIDIRGATKEDVQRVATAISKAVNPNYNYRVQDENLGYAAMHAYHPDYAGLNGVGFSNEGLLDNCDDVMVKDMFKSAYKVELLGTLTVDEAIKKFDL